MDPTPTPTAAQQFVDTIVTMLQPVIFALLTYLAGQAIVIAQRFMKRLGLQADAERDAKLKATAESAVLEVEERVESAIKSGLTPAVEKSAMKLEQATAIIVNKVPGVSDDEAESLAHEAVARVGLGATAAAGKLVAASQSPN
jgi:hypothetical protein